MPPALPTFVELPADLGAHAEPLAEIWYVTCHLAAGDRQLGLQAMVTTSPSGKLFTSLSLVDSAGRGRHAITPHAAGEARLATGALDIDAGEVVLRGTTEELELEVLVEGARARLVLERDHPILFSCLTGTFPYFGGPTHQFALPALAASGTIELDGERVAVTGRGWLDRQWSASRDAFGAKHGFTWFGLWLDDGRTMSIWDTTGSGGGGSGGGGSGGGGPGGGYAWATIAAPDGTHTVAAITPLPAWTGAPPAEWVPAEWIVAIPGIDARLAIAHRPVHVEPRFYSGLCTVTGEVAGAPVAGAAVVDAVPR